MSNKTTMAEVEELKALGNQYILSKPPQYEKAIEAYSKALSLDPTHHTILSNRSLAHFKLSKYEKALEDAEKAVLSCPTWAKGYLRKCAALNMLKRYCEAQEAAEAGYRLMHSTGLCKDFVAQWLKACEALYAIEELPTYLPPGPADLCQLMIIKWVQVCSANNVEDHASFLPNGLVVISKQYWEVLFHCLASYMDMLPSLALTQELTQKHLSSVANEFTRVLSLFGQSVGKELKDWVNSITRPSSGTQSTQIASYLKSQIHQPLFPLVHSLLALAVTVVCARVYTLNAASTGFSSINGMLNCCLTLFDNSVLTADKYVGLHLKVLTGLVDSYNRRFRPITRDECVELARHCKKIETLMPLLSSCSPFEYQQLGGSFEQIVATAKTLILARQTGVAIPFQGVPDSPQQMTLASALRDVEKRPTEVKEFAVKNFQDIIRKPRRMMAIQDGQNLLQLTEIFMKLSDFEQARQALLTGEQIVLALVGLQLQQGTLLLNEASSTIATLRQQVLMSAILMKELDIMLVSDLMIRWKSLFSEFKAVVIMMGLRNAYSTTVKELNDLHSMSSHPDKEVVALIKENHEKMETEFLSQHAFKCWGVVVDIAMKTSIEKILESDELIIEFVQVGEYDPVKLRAFLNMWVMTILPTGERELEAVDFTACNHAVKNWLREWNAYTDEGSSPSKSRVSSLIEAGKELSSLLFPPSVQKIIKQSTVKHVYLSAEPFGALPFHLLPGEDEVPLFENCTVSLINACRELLREAIVDHLSREVDKTSSTQQPTGASGELSQSRPGPSKESKQLDVVNVIEASSAETQPLSESEFSNASQLESESLVKTSEATDCIKPSEKHNECYVFADPNYELALSKATSKDTSVTKTLLSFFAEKLSWTESVRCEQLPSSKLEAEGIEKTAQSSPLKLSVHTMRGDSATLNSLLKLKSPYIVHFSTHGFGRLDLKVSTPSIWDDTQSGLALAGFNTYKAQKFAYIDPNASIGILTPLAIQGIDLKGTRLVFLSTCVSAIGASALLESTNSLANAFRVAGALTVIATIWKIPDESTAHLVRYFYEKALQPGVRPSEALKWAQDQLCSNYPGHSSLLSWAGFVCHGDDLPLNPFPVS